MIDAQRAAVCGDEGSAYDAIIATDAADVARGLLQQIANDIRSGAIKP
jgi:hypothetical protein